MLQTTTRDPLEIAKGLAPLIEAHADETEQGSKMAEEVVQAFRDTRMFWMNVPKELGGDDLDMHTRLAVLEELSRADGATGWAFMAIAGYVGYTAVGCGDEAVQQLYGDPDNMQLVAGMANPVGHATKVDGGYTIRGNYRFGSGAPHADWIATGAVIQDTDGAQICGFVPTSKVKFKGNWDVIGLVGTGSVDYDVPEQFVPEAFSFDASNYVPQRGGASGRMDFFSTAMVYHAAMALGVAKRALEEVVKIADTRKQRPGALPIGEQQMFLHDFCLNEGRLRAARAAVSEAIDGGLEAAERGEPLGAVAKGRFRQSCNIAHAIAMQTVEFAYYWGGSVSLRKPNPLGRCMLDMHALNQHLLVDHNNLVDVAPAILDTYRRGPNG